MVALAALAGAGPVSRADDAGISLSFSGGPPAKFLNLPPLLDVPSIHSAAVPPRLPVAHSDYFIVWFESPSGRFRAVLPATEPFFYNPATSYLSPDSARTSTERHILALVCQERALRKRSVIVDSGDSQSH